MLEAHSPAVLLACLVFGPIPLYPAGIPGLSHSTQNPTSEPIAIERFVRGSVRGQDPAGEVREEGNPTLEAERGSDDPTRSADPQDKPERDELPSIESFVTGMQAFEGLINCWWDSLEGKLFLAPPPAETELLSLVSLPGGLGSNEVGLDRGQLGEQRLVRFERHGARILLVAPNLRWRAEGASAAVAAGVADSFAPGVLWGFELVAQDEAGGVLVDATDFFLRDAHGIARKLKSTGQGDYQLEASRSTLLPERLRAFPQNLDVEALMTFVAEDPGAEVAATSGDPRAPALRVRHSFIALPELDPARYAAREGHPHSGFFGTVWSDLTAPIDAALERRVVNRHRLRADEPIVYYIDSAAPEPVRTALLEGARYWQPVFAAAGFPDGFRAELLPEGADPQDVRYNVVQWVQRSTRGWSYGNSVRDPRTGEILKGHVSLGALRVRQDVLLAEGLLAPYADGDESDARVLEMALARIRQLSAHEIGHTLGLAHNFAASAHGRASVMDYPAPHVDLVGEDGLDLADAYREGCGEWDELAVRYGYGRPELSGEEERAYLAGVIAEMRARGQRFLTDGDARGADRAHPLANLWDDGSDPIAGLEHALEVRRRAMAGLSVAALKSDRAPNELERVLLPVYLHHRYQLEACARQLGGVDYDHFLVGEGGASARPVEAARQRAALAMCLQTLEPSRLELDPGLTRTIAALAPGRGLGREAFASRRLLFEPSQAARAAIEIALGLLLNEGRLARMEDQVLIQPELPSADELVNAMLTLAWGVRQGESAPQAALRRELRALVLRRLFSLSTRDGAPVRVRAVGLRALQVLEPLILGLPSRDPQRALELDWLRRFREEASAMRSVLSAPRIPPGSPIGCGAQFEPSRD